MPESCIAKHLQGEAFEDGRIRSLGLFSMARGAKNVPGRQRGELGVEKRRVKGKGGEGWDRSTRSRTGNGDDRERKRGAEWIGEVRNRQEVAP
jgi:hypothetical protein